MRNLVTALIIALSLGSQHALAISADDLATREGEVIFGQAWLSQCGGGSASAWIRCASTSLRLG